jgi:hypothetical protein
VNDTWRNWLDADRDGRLEEADQAFAALASSWTRSVPPASLVARVAALGSAPRRSLAWNWESMWLRLSVGAGLVLCGLALGVLSGRALGAALLASIQTVAAGVGSMLALADAWGRAAVAVGLVLARVARACGSALTEPIPLVFVLVNVLLAGAALAALRRVLSVREV